MVLATRGRREREEGGEEDVADPEVAHQLRCQARSVHLHALAFAALCTALMLAIEAL